MIDTHPLNIAIQGITASFHEAAAHKYFGTGIQTIHCLTFRNLCDKLKNQEADYAVMAIENAIAGSILPNYFLLQEYHFTIVGETYLPIQMHLMALPGVTMEEITTIESHPMALRQCTEYLRSWDQIQLRESDDTALSASKISELQLRDTAAIAGEFAADRFGLQILHRNIETHRKNYTRFLILSKKNKLIENSNKASLYFQVQNEVGSLVDALTIFQKNHINLSKIQSIPIIGRPSEYTMHVDVEWEHRTHYDQAMQQLLRQVQNLNVLGEYQKGKIDFISSL